jgi:hypothetical protein
MTLKKTVGTTVCALVAVLIGSTARADSVCETGEHDVTPAERATMTAALETARKALPAPPQGWVVVGDDAISVPSRYCKDVEGPFHYAFTRHYKRVDDQEARNEMMNKAMTDAAAEMKQKQPRLDAIRAKSEVLGQEMAAAAQRNDWARVEEINKQIAAVGAEYEKVLKEGDTMERMNAATDQAARDQDMTVTVAINSRSEARADGAESLELPAGAHSAVRWNEARGSLQEGHALVLFGPWRPTDSGFDAATLAGADASAAHTIAVRVTTDASRLGATVGAIDSQALAASLAK